MIKSHIIIMAMGEMSHNSLRYALLNYVEVSKTEVKDIIQKGVSGWLEDYIAFVLELKTSVGFNPRKRTYKPKPKQLVLDRVYDNPRRGKSHHRYKNGSCVGNHPLERYK